MKKSIWMGTMIAALAVAGTCSADVVAEWKFDQEADIAAGGDVTLDKATPGASTLSSLRPKSQVVAGPTGLAAPWADYLLKGYLDVGPAAGDGGKDQQGLVTKDSTPGAKDGVFKKYFGYSGISSGNGGTIVVVFSPTTDWTAGGRKGLFGTGSMVTGGIGLGTKKTGELLLRLGGQKDPVTALTPVKWQVGKWYAAAASWSSGQKAVLVVCELGADPKASVDAATTAESASPCPTLETPRLEPLSLGSAWINTGNESFTIDGGESHIAYARLENTAASADALKQAILGLASGTEQK